MKEKILVSACLLGINCKYNGSNNISKKIISLSEKKDLIPVCPEQLGGLRTPRKKIFLQDGTGKEVLEGKALAINEDNVNVSDNLIKGAKETRKIARLLNINKAILKSKSPSCATRKIKNKKTNIVGGKGVTAKILEREGLELLNDKDI